MVYGTNGRWWRWNPCSVLKGFGVVTSRPRSGPRTNAADRDSRSSPFETSPSPVAYVLYACSPKHRPEVASTVDSPRAFGFHERPVVTGLDATGALFDTTTAMLSADRETIDYHLQFGGKHHPYQLVHAGGGTYRSQDSEMDFRWSDGEQFQELDAFLRRGQPYHVVVRDVVQLTQPDGRFDWSVSRTDISVRHTDRLAISLLVIVWRIGNPGDDPADCRRGAPGKDVFSADGPAPPEFPADLTPSVDDRTITETATSLIDAGALTGASP